MNSAINYIGKYRFKEQAIRHREPYWQSKVSYKGQSKSVIDVAGIDENGQNVVNLLPYKANSECSHIDSILQDGDLLAYVQGPMDIAIPSDISSYGYNDSAFNRLGDVLKGRATHAELGYLNSEKQAMQISLWGRTGPMEAEDRRFFTHTNGDAISIYRVSLKEYNVDSHVEKLLKAEVKRWKEMVKPILFPFGAEMNIDPADFNTIEELYKIAEECINHSPNDSKPLFNFKLNCVQWSTLVFSLAVCFPLSERMLKEMGHYDAYRANWATRLGYAEDGLMGIRELPIPFYTMEEILENTLDMYLPEHKTYLMSFLRNLPLQQLLSKLGDVNSRRVMPNAFVIENRLRGVGIKRSTKSVFKYIGTAVPENELTIV